MSYVPPSEDEINAMSVAGLLDWFAFDDAQHISAEWVCEKLGLDPNAKVNERYASIAVDEYARLDALRKAIHATPTLMVDRFPASPTESYNAGQAAGWNSLLARLLALYPKETP